MSVFIKHISTYVPETKLSNKSLADSLNIEEHWITERTGILQRNVSEGKPLSDMAIKSSLKLLQETGLSPVDIGLVICATVTGDYTWPATAGIIAEAIGAVNAWGYDLSAACSGFLYGLETAAGFIARGKYKNILLVAADKMSSCIDYSVRDTAVLFGDGACSMLIQPCENESGIMDTFFRMDGAGMQHLYVKAGGSLLPATEENIRSRLQYLFMAGPQVFKAAIKYMVLASREILKNNHLTVDDIDWFVPHQANQRIINAVGEKLEMDSRKILSNVANYGNTTNASIPLCLWENQHQFKKGDLILMTAFGAGFTYGAMLYRWI